MKNIIVLSLSLLGLMVVPVVIQQATASTLLPTYPMAPSVTTASEVVITATPDLPQVDLSEAPAVPAKATPKPKSKSVEIFSEKELVWVCGPFQESLAGGQYRQCEWK